MTQTKFRKTTRALALTITAMLAGCGGGSSGNNEPANNYNCLSGASETLLYTYQWFLKSITSYFSTGNWDPAVTDRVTDLNVESVHTDCVKGTGVRVLVIDDGLELTHEDLSAYADQSMSWNFATGENDPNPSNRYSSHGTVSAGVIAANQNGYGVMGVAPQVTLGGALYLDYDSPQNTTAAYGGAAWSKIADIINASYGSSSGPTGGFVSVPDYKDADPGPTAIQKFPTLRGGKGLLMVKSAGNGYADGGCPLVTDGSNTVRLSSCENPASDADNLQVNLIGVAAASAMGKRSSYSSAGAVNWVTGLGGESVAKGNYGEVGVADDPEFGPQLFSTDLSSCERGASRDYTRYPPTATENPLSMLIEFIKGGSTINLQSNKDKNGQATCNYATHNGTSAAAPTVSGVVALMLQANPNLTWRDVRDILRRTAKSNFDADYGTQGSRNYRVNLADYTLTTNTSSTLTNGDTTARVDLGWQTNAAGNRYSNWYGFGLVNAKDAVAAAKATTTYKPAALTVPSFTSALTDRTVTYGQVSELGSFTLSGSDQVDAIQLQLNSDITGLCLGSVGIYLQSPKGTVSILQTPYNQFYKNNVILRQSSTYVLGSYAFYGESAAGTWKVFAVSGTPNAACTTAATGKVSVAYRLFALQ